MRHAIRLQMLQTQLSAIQAVRPIGRINGTRGNVLTVSGLNDVARIGDRVSINRLMGDPLSAEVVQLSQSDATVIPDGPFDGVALNDRVVVDQQNKIAPNETWLGRIVDPNGEPLDGRPLGCGPIPRPLKNSPPAAASRRPLGKRMDTGHLVFDTMLPIVRGQRVGLFAGSGVGKSNLMGQLAKRMSADVVVVAMIGERGREVRHFVDSVLGPDGLAKSVVVAATSDQSPLIRRRCAWTAMAVAEHFRDEGMSVLFLADSITRFAEAHREVASAAGEAPVLRGFPASTSHLIMSLCERAGPGGPDQGDITGVFSVLVAGSDMEEPIADILRGVLDGHVVLDREIAERGRFPAVDILRSVSRSLPDAATTTENETIAQVRKLMSVFAQNQMMINAGLYTQGTDPDIDMAIQASSHLDTAMSQVHEQGCHHSFDQLGLALRRGGVTASGRKTRK
ncbi:FliI/YscN family ATPase [Tateyamaria omphalii]|uniref:FliI/YscN family ATPase n=1 Tax=Tateyamaria omphalii TaxID=299262 RepID=UPI001C9A2B2A|nr:FliI/YscN family ATPase [Tateyamaria omphalii]MBY5933618.1 FliI/YscN family ATPase [Tateyamaria omphalii]